jgi:chemotaxis protein MotB
MGALKAQQAQTAQEQKLADSLAAQLKDLQSRKDAADKGSSALQSQLETTQGQLKSSQDQLTSLQQSNDVLRQSLESKKSDLQTEVAQLTQQKDDLAKSAADMTKNRDDVARALAATQADSAAVEKANAAELDQAKKNDAALTAQLQNEIMAGEVTITQLQGKLTVSMVDRILFDSGSAGVKQSGQKILAQIAGALNDLTNKNILIEGYTDNEPIGADLRDKYSTNWELSTARATAVARFLQDSAGVDPHRLEAAGFGEFRPVASNDTPEGRTKNRRIDIVLVAKD